MNKIILLGRLTRDPEIRYTQSGKVVASFTIAVDRPFAGQDGKREADFINCVLWGKSAETFGNGVFKGHRTLVEGRLQVRSYDGKDGSKKYATEVICDRFEFIEHKADGNTPKASQSAPRSQQASSMESFGSAVDFNEEIPF